MTDDELLQAIADVRQRTIAVYVQMAALVTALPSGWRVRQPGEPDVTLALIRQALRDAPEATRVLLRVICANDMEVVRLTKELAHE